MKRVLALCLAMCMILCLSATAASVEFTDRGDIFNSEEASMLTSLGIIQGFPDGKFRPNDWVTRAQLAKMIYYMQNGVMDKSEDLSASYTGSDFSDVQGHWASGYIYYCARKGIISGYTDGTFKPDKNVSATEAAKMLLVSIGYDEDRYIGSQWLANTHFDAAVAGITNGYNDHMTATLNRDNAALFIYNTLFSAIISGENSGKTLIQTGYGAKRYTAVVIANEVAALEGAICGKGLTRVRTIGSDANVFMLNESSSAAELGHTYAVYVTANTDENGNHDLYGGFFTTPDDLTVIDTSRSVGFSDVVGYGKTFTGVSSGASFHLNYSFSIDRPTFEQTISSHPDWKVIYISNNGDTILDRAIVLSSWLCQVESVDFENIKFYSRPAISIDNVLFTGSVSVGDFYTVTQIGANYLLENASYFVGSINNFSAGESITSGEKTYPVSSDTCYVSDAHGTFVPAAKLSMGGYTGQEMTMLLNSSGLICGAFVHGVENRSYALVTGAKAALSLVPGGKSGNYDVSVLLGSSGTVSSFKYASQTGAPAPGLYSYAATDSSGGIFGLEEVTSALPMGSPFAVTNSSSYVAGLGALAATENTAFFFWSGNAAQTPACYHGIQNVPDFEGTVSPSMQLYYAESGGELKAVYITASDPGISMGRGYVYIFNSAPLSGSSSDGHYLYEGYIDGASVLLKTPHRRITSGLYAYSTASGITTLYDVGGANCIKTEISNIFSGFITLKSGSSPSSIHNWADADLYKVDSASGTVTKTDTLFTKTDVIIIYTRTGETTANASCIFIGNGVRFGSVG
ncbi:MAG: S-layer homology domain-containing protein [Oscillospiraceae bacterium]|nr:S-layer homology domain-containing protein [Oscillospiraceae bacterium]